MIPHKSGSQLYFTYQISEGLPLIPTDRGHWFSLTGQLNCISDYFLPEKQLYYELPSLLNTLADTSFPHIYEKEKYAEENGVPRFGDWLREKAWSLKVLFREMRSAGNIDVNDSRKSPVTTQKEQWDEEGCQEELWDWKWIGGYHRQLYLLSSFARLLYPGCFRNKKDKCFSDDNTIEITTVIITHFVCRILFLSLDL